MDKSKACKYCGETFPLHDFEKAKRMREGRSNRCKYCARRKCKERSQGLVEKWATTDPWETHPTGMKTCPQCRQKKAVRDFSRSTHDTDGLQRECKPCQVNRYQRRLYGIAPGPGDSCQICGATANLHVDHCHATEMVRGILCKDCNIGLGFFHDDTDRLKKAIEYLETATPIGPLTGKKYPARKKQSKKRPIDWSRVHS